VKANIGDRLVLNGTHVGDRRRVGVVTAVRNADHSPPYLVKWQGDDHETLLYPGPDARIEPGDAGE
jgi:hypothetical protein